MDDGAALSVVADDFVVPVDDADADALPMGMGGDLFESRHDVRRIPIAATTAASRTVMPAIVARDAVASRLVANRHEPPVRRGIHTHVRAKG